MLWTLTIITLSVVSQASVIVEEEMKTTKKYFTDEEKVKFLDIISTYKHNLQKLESNELIHRYSRCLSSFDKSEEDPSKAGWGWNPPTSTTTNTCSSVGQSCTRDYTNSRDSSTDSEDNIKNEEKGWGSTSGWSSSSGWSSNTSNSSQTCCNQDICYKNRCCTPTPAISTHSICTLDSDCCGYSQGLARCDVTLGICRTPLGQSCEQTSDCYSGICGVDGLCCYLNGGCQAPSDLCTADLDCCGYGVCINGTCLGGSGDTCGCNSGCNSPATCNMGICCGEDNTACESNSDCCGNHACTYMTNMCAPMQVIDGDCSGSVTCDSGMFCYSETQKCSMPLAASSPCGTGDECECRATCENGYCCVPDGTPCTTSLACCGDSECLLEICVSGGD